MECLSFKRFSEAIDLEIRFVYFIHKRCRLVGTEHLCITESVHHLYPVRSLSVDNCAHLPTVVSLCQGNISMPKMLKVENSKVVKICSGPMVHMMPKHTKKSFWYTGYVYFEVIVWQ